MPAAAMHADRLVAPVALTLLLLSASAAPADPPLPVIPAGEFSILDYGGSTVSADNSGSILAAIAAARAAGGGTVVIPSGTFAANPFTVTTGTIDLRIDGTLLAPTMANFGSAGNYITWSNVSNVRMSGAGTIDGQGADWWSPPASSRPRLVRFNNCQTVEVTGLTAVNSPSFFYALSGSANANYTFDRLTITAPSNSPNTDGIDVLGSGILIKRCTIAVGDDNIALKSDSQFCSDITIANTTFGSGHGVSIGGGSAHGLSTMLVTSCTFNGTTNGLRLKAEDAAGSNAGGGLAHPVTGVTYDGITMTNVTHPIVIDSFYDGSNNFPTSPTDPTHYPAAALPVGATTPMWENIAFRNITATGCTDAGLIYGLNTEPRNIQGLSFTNVQITAASHMNLWYAADVDLSGLTITVPPSDAFYGASPVSGASLYAVSVPEPAGVTLGLTAVLVLLGGFRSRWLPMFLVAAVSAVVPARADWPHWRGDGGNGVSLTARPPVEFGPDRNVSWTIEIPGRGSSSPVITGDRGFVTTAVPVEGEAGVFDFRLLCFDRETGRERWSRSCVKAAPHEGTHETNGYASASPCTDGERVYAHFGSRGLHAFTVAGEHLWSRDFGDMTVRNGFGEGSSPTLAGELIIVPWDHEGPSMLFALDKRTGKTVWETPRDEPTCWATPLIVTDAGGTTQVVMNGEHAARGYDLATGRELWRCGGQTQRPCASAVANRGKALIGSGFRGSFFGCFDLAGRGDLRGSSHVLWTKNAGTPDVASPLLSDGRLFYYKEKTGLLTCIDAATGEPYYETVRVPGVARTYASPVAAAGHVYLTDRSGRITVIEDGTRLNVVAENDVGEGVDATPALAGDSLFVRGERHLFRFARP